MSQSHDWKMSAGDVCAFSFRIRNSTTLSRVIELIDVYFSFLFVTKTQLTSRIDEILSHERNDELLRSVCP